MQFKNVGRKLRNSGRKEKKVKRKRWSDTYNFEIVNCSNEDNLSIKNKFFIFVIRSGSLLTQRTDL